MQRIAAVAMVVGALGLGACDAGQDVATEIADPDRYCQLTQLLDQAGDREIDLDFEAATPDPETVQAEFSDFVSSFGDELEELERVAPPEIADDVATLNETVRTVAETGDLGAFDASAEAEERIQDYERETCGTES